MHFYFLSVKVLLVLVERLDKSKCAATVSACAVGCSYFDFAEA